MCIKKNCTRRTALVVQKNSWERVVLKAIFRYRKVPQPNLSLLSPLMNDNAKLVINFINTIFRAARIDIFRLRGAQNSYNLKSQRDSWFRNITAEG